MSVAGQIIDRSDPSVHFVLEARAQDALILASINLMTIHVSSDNVIILAAFPRNGGSN
jgi:hypothetical protein